MPCAGSRCHATGGDVRIRTHRGSHVPFVPYCPVPCHKGRNGQAYDKLGSFLENARFFRDWAFMTHWGAFGPRAVAAAFIMKHVKFTRPRAGARRAGDTKDCKLLVLPRDAVFPPLHSFILSILLRGRFVILCVSLREILAGRHPCICIAVFALRVKGNCNLGDSHNTVRPGCCCGDDSESRGG